MGEKSKIKTGICKNCGEEIYYIPTKVKNVYLRVMTEEERKKPAWRHKDGYKHCMVSLAKPTADDH